MITDQQIGPKKNGNKKSEEDREEEARCKEKEEVVLFKSASDLKQALIIDNNFIWL